MTDLRPGDEVFGSLWDSARMLHPPGTFAELTVARASQVIEKPARVSFEEAGGAVMSGLTALIAIRDVGRVGQGTRVLINGASGGVGTFAAQIAKALGAQVTAVCSTRNVEREPREPGRPRRIPRIRRRPRRHRRDLHARRRCGAVAHMLGHHARGKLVIAV